jgi:hypothetical protein
LHFPHFLLVEKRMSQFVACFAGATKQIASKKPIAIEQQNSAHKKTAKHSRCGKIIWLFRSEWSCWEKNESRAC